MPIGMPSRILFSSSLDALGPSCPRGKWTGRTNLSCGMRKCLTRKVNSESGVPTRLGRKVFGVWEFLTLTNLGFLTLANMSLDKCKTAGKEEFS